ncbi:AraC family transcriptional regulator [Arcobacter roscoffensis]|uniref:AraC family transcriptional regulator n=1 Tax=Arcobacter roscoffensis TaxID=2961520 RepID=A0ABY5E4W6_9BACT|nr:AraC family transcriptional regulator [Arcobacter roscoffensis]UTJ06220.1 AraC family transcriptional regulator [Arcobacter roscoffensis]
MSKIFYIDNHFKNITMNKHFHEEYTISLVYEGVHTFITEKGTLNARANSLQIINPFEYHSTQKSTWSHLNIMIPKAIFEQTAKNILQKEIDFSITLENIISDEVSISLFKDLYESLENENVNEILIDSNLINFVENLLEFHSLIKEENIKATNLNKDKIEKSLKYIEKNIYRQDLNLEDIASHINLSKYHFLREFKKKTGLTVNQFIQVKKVVKIRELQKQNLPLSHIAYECGFTDQSHMIKVFKKHVGYTPSKVKNSTTS